MADEHGDPADALPPGVRLAWGLRDGPRPGRKPGLDHATILGAAIALADAEGLPAVSMSRLAGELGFTTMSLYRYVTGKDELLQLMFDAAMGPPPEDVPPGWRPGLDAWTRALRGAYRAHPWTTEIPIGGAPVTPNQLHWMDRGLEIMSRTALHPAERPSVVLLLSGFVRNAAGLERDLARAGQFETDGVDLMRTWGDLVLRLADGRMPSLAAVIGAGAFDDEDPVHPAAELEFADAEFEFGLARLLDGVAALVRAREGSP